MIFFPRAVEVEFLKGLALPLHLFLPFSSASPPPNTHLRVQPAAGHVAGEHAREHGARVLFWKREFEGEEDKGERESDLMLFLGRATTTTMLSRTRRKAPPSNVRGPSLPHSRCLPPLLSAAMWHRRLPLSIDRKRKTIEGPCKAQALQREGIGRERKTLRRRRERQACFTVKLAPRLGSPFSTTLSTTILPCAASSPSLQTPARPRTA